MSQWLKYGSALKLKIVITHVQIKALSHQSERMNNDGKLNIVMNNYTDLSLLWI